MPDIPEEAVQAATAAITNLSCEHEGFCFECEARAAVEASAPLIRAQARREAAAHILIVDALRCGLRCAYCHAPRRAVSVGTWECANGHRYGRVGGCNSGDTLMTALRRLADHDELPLMPARRPSSADAVLEQARQIGEAQ